VETPSRYAKTMLIFTKGYKENLKLTVNNAVFQEGHDEMGALLLLLYPPPSLPPVVLVKDIEIYSICGHHLVPFIWEDAHRLHSPGQGSGLSKFARIAEVFGRPLQLQEQLMKQFAAGIEEILEPLEVVVVMESAHLFIVMRGLEKTPRLLQPLILCAEVLPEED